MILTGIVTAIGGWFVFPRFLAGELSAFKGEFAMIDELAAQAQLAQTGIPMKARILNMAPTGTTINHSPQVSAALEVQGPNGPYLVGNHGSRLADVHPAVPARCDGDGARQPAEPERGGGRVLRKSSPRSPRKRKSAPAWAKKVVHDGA